MADTPNSERRRRGQGGFSLIELIVVITIIGILATVVVVNVGGQDDKARVTKVKSDFKAIKTAISIFKMDNHRYPESLEELMNPPEGGQPYLDQEPLDPWTQEPYIFEPTDTGALLISYGADMSEGGENFNEDIYSDEMRQ